MNLILGEARMVLPQIQALFGFQITAVFNARFADLSETVVQIYLIALGLLVLAFGLVKSPAACHRLAEPNDVTRRRIDTSSRLLSAALLPLALDCAILTPAAAGLVQLTVACTA